MDKGWDEIFEAEAPAPEGEGAALTDDGTAPADGRMDFEKGMRCLPRLTVLLIAANTAGFVTDARAFRPGVDS